VYLATDKLEPGLHDILVRAKDQVGNSGEPKWQEVNIVPKVTPRKLTEEEKKQQQANTVTGRVLYGGQPIDDADVVLEPPPPGAGAVKTDANGNFTFANVPPGKYKVTARGMARGGWRRAEDQIEVLPRGKPPTVVTLNAGITFRGRP
jgi:protocatechuate 3,4-dioxygenase beta subunit